jgi:hypothetical protein
MGRTTKGNHGMSSATLDNATSANSAENTRFIIPAR